MGSDSWAEPLKGLDDAPVWSAKWRCGPVELPVVPDSARTWPWVTACPSLTLNDVLCAYRDT